MNRKTIRQIPITLITIAGLAMASLGHSNDDLSASIQADYQHRLGDMFKHFHANPELSTGDTLYSNLCTICTKIRESNKEIHC